MALMILISACLVGFKTRYDGKAAPRRELVELLKKGKVIPLCPEQLGGLPTPREPVEIVGGDGFGVLKGKAKLKGKLSGKDFTHEFLKGAQEVLRLVKILKIKEAILVDGSPSCGINFILRKGKKVKGMGVLAASLKEGGIILKTK